jgi:selenocysteine-specific elongation factor
VYVIGTSGHIDHGKTSLIQSLTGIDCDRLPEEKARQMTIDIGFASMELPGFGIVSVIDVPGHERFIRNMVAGAWGIDLGLLVVAADDGWMPQTEDHFRVLELLAVERIIVVISKIDLSDEDILTEVERQVRERLSGTAYSKADSVRVSSKIGAGIEDLKKIIAENLAKLSQARDADKPFLYIDRVFAPHGHGTVVTGTLKNGILAENDLVYIQPGGREARVKRVESHHSAKEQGRPSQRTALNLSGITADMLKRGSILYKRNFFTESAEIMARIRLLKPDREIKNNQGIEVLIGTAAVKGKIILISDFMKSTSLAARIKFERTWYCYPGQPFVITSPGGFRIVGGGTVLFPGYDKIYGQQATAALSLFRSYSAEELIAFIVSVRRWLKKYDLAAMLPQSDDAVDAMLISMEVRNVIRIIGDYVAMPDTFDGAMQIISQTVKNHLGPNIKEISDYAGVDIEICRLMIPVIQKSLPVIEKEGRLFWENGSDGQSLSKEKQHVMDMALQNSGRGFEIEKIQNETIKRDARELIRLKHLVSLDGNIVFHKKIYEELTNSIMRLFDGRDKISISDAKEATGLSRKYLIPLLNRIERDGLIKRLGDFRVKV